MVTRRLPEITNSFMSAVSVGNAPRGTSPSHMILGGGELGPTKTDATTITGVRILRAQPPAR